MSTDNLSWVDEAFREECKALHKPTEEQHAMAKFLDDQGGGYSLMATCTFRPNEFEEGVIKVGSDEYVRNLKVSWTEGERIVKRVGRDGQMFKGTRAVSPGWSAAAAEGQVLNWINGSKHLKRTRWFFCIESSKYRNCAHGHVLFANGSRVPWEKEATRWTSKHGRFGLEQVKDDDGMAMYLAKQYVGKEFGQDQFKYRISRNSKSPIEDDCPKIGYNYRMMLFYNAMKKDESKRAKMVRWKDFKKMMRIK